MSVAVRFDGAAVEGFAHRTYLEVSADAEESGRVLLGAGAVGVDHMAAMGGVEELDEPEGTVTFALPARAASYTMTVARGSHARTTLTLGADAHDRLMVGVGTILSQL